MVLFYDCGVTDSEKSLSFQPFCFCEINTAIKPGPAPREAFWGRAFPNYCLCSPSEGCAPKESNRLSATGVHFGVCAPKILLVPPSPSGSKVSFQNKKREWMPRRSLRFCGRWRLFLVFIPEFEGKNWEPHHIRFRRAPQAVNVPPPPERELCPERRQTARIHGA